MTTFSRTKITTPKSLIIKIPTWQRTLTEMDVDWYKKGMRIDELLSDAQLKQFMLKPNIKFIIFEHYIILY